MKSILSYFTAPPSGPTISPSSQSIAEPAKVYKNSLEVVEDNHTDQRGSGELVGVPGVIEQANAKRRRMNTDTRSAETDREGTAARLLDTIPSVSLSASGINVPRLPSEDYSAGSEKCEGLCCNDDTVPYQPTEASVLGKTKTIYGMEKASVN